MPTKTNTAKNIAADKNPITNPFINVIRFVSIFSSHVLR